jgi:hypothetical protein
MKKFVAILVAAMMLLSGLTAFAGPVEEQNAYIALIKAGLSNPDFVIRHFESIDAIDATTLDTYFAAIDAAIKVAMSDNSLNLVGAQWATILANFNAVIKALEMSYEIVLEIPTEYVAAEDEEGNTVYEVVDTDWIVIDATDLVVGIDLYAIVTEATIAALAEEEVDATAEDFDWETVEAVDGFGFAFYCEEAGICLAQGAALSAVDLGLGALATTVNANTGYYAASGLRTWFGNFKAAIAACAACNPVAAAPVEDTADRLPDTATSYGNLVVMGVVMMVVAAAAVVGIKKVAFNA